MYAEFQVCLNDKVSRFRMNFSTERRDVTVSSTASYYECLGFESRPRYLLSCLKVFLVGLNLSRHMSKCCFNVGHNNHLFLRLAASNCTFS